MLLLFFNYYDHPQYLRAFRDGTAVVQSSVWQQHSGSKAQVWQKYKTVWN